MKKQFLSKSVPRGTRTIWRYLGALFLLFTFAIGNVWAADEEIIKVVLSGSNGATKTMSGTIGGTCAVDKLSSSSPYKLNSNGAYVSLTLSTGYFEPTDIVTITGADKAHQIYYGTPTSGTLLCTTPNHTSGTITCKLKGIPANQNTIYVYRASDTYSGKLATMAVTRPDLSPTGSATISYTLTQGKDDVIGDVSNVNTIDVTSTKFTKSTLSIGSSNAQSGYCGQITNQGTSEHKNTSNYVSLSFDIADGYIFSPSAVSVTVKSNYDKMYSQVEISDGTTTVISGEFGGATSDQSASFAADAFNDVKFSGTVTLKVYQWMTVSGSSKRAYIKSPVTITGTVATAAPKYDVVFANGGEGTGSMATLKYEAGEEVTLPACGYTPVSGREFNGWTSSDVTISAGKFTMPSKNVTITATWRDEAVKYTVTYDVSGGSSAIPTETDKAAGDEFALAAAPEYEGYHFEGWLCDADAATYDAEDAYTMTAANTTFTAQWKPYSTISIANKTYIIGSGNFNAVSDFSSNCEAAVIYELKESYPGVTLTPAGVFSATAAGEYIVVANQAGDATYAATSKEFTVTVLDNELSDTYVWKKNASYTGCIANPNADAPAAQYTDIAYEGFTGMGRAAADNTECILTFTVKAAYSANFGIKSICTYGKLEEPAGGQISWDGGANWEDLAAYAEGKKEFNAPSATFPTSFKIRFMGVSKDAGGLYWRNALVTLEAKKTVTGVTEALVGAEINGEAIANISTLQEDKTLDIATAYAAAPTVTFKKQVTTSYAGGWAPDVENVDVEVTASDNTTAWQASATIGGQAYTINLAKPAGPSLETEATAFTLTSAKIATDSKNFTFSGVNLAHNVTILLESEVAGMSVTPAVVIPSENAITDQEVTITYKSLENVAEAVVNLIVAYDEDTKITIPLTYSSTVGYEDLTSISAATTWNWDGAASAAYGTLGQNDMIILANADVTWDEGFNARAIAGKLQHYYRDGKYAQGDELKFNTTIPGKVYVTYSNTGGNAARTVNVNGVKGSLTTEGSGEKRTESFAVNAGDVLIKGVQVSDDAAKMLRYYEVRFAPVYSVTYNAGEGSVKGGETMPTQADEAAGEKIVLAAATALEKDGYDFAGWLCDIDAQTYQPGDEYTMTAAATTFTAQWVLHVEPVDPTLTYDEGAYMVGGAALDLSSLITAQTSTGAISYSIKDAGTTGATLEGKNFSATAAGTAVITASQEAVLGYNAKTVDFSVVVTEATEIDGIKMVEAGALTGNFRIKADQLKSGAYTVEGINYSKYVQMGSTHTSFGGETEGTQTKGIYYAPMKKNITFWFYMQNTESSTTRKIYVYTIEEGKAITSKTVDVEAGSHLVSTDITLTTNAEIVFGVDNTKLLFCQIVAVESGDDLLQGGQAGYVFDYSKKRQNVAANTLRTIDGIDYKLSAESKINSASNVQLTTLGTHYIKFHLDAPMTVNVYADNKKYYVGTECSTEDDAMLYEATGDGEFTLAAGNWYINGSGAQVKINKIEFNLPKCAKPVVADLDNVDYCTGETIDALTVSATVSDGGTMLYQWYKDGEIIAGAEAATYQPTEPAADGEYYVVVVNTKAGHQNSDPTQSNTITVAGHDGTAISGTTGAEDWPSADVTISVTASGKNLSYAWYTCDDALGTNPVAVDPAVNAAELDVTVGAADSYYKVIVSGDCGSAQEAVITVVARQAVEQVNVTEATVWNFATSIAGSTSLENQTDVVLANVDGINNNASFNSQALKGTFNKMPGNYFQGSKLSFTTEVAGMLRVIFRGTNNNSRHLQICVGEGEEVIADWDYKGSGEGAEKDSAIYVPAGKVTLKALEGTAAQNARIYRMELVTEDSYHRTVNPSNIGTLCWTNDAVLGGATLYELAGKDANSKLVFDEVPENRLVAGKPYIFVPENGNTVIKVYNTTDDEPLTAPLVAIKQMQGTFVDMTTVGTTEGDGDLWYKYIISNNHYIYVDYQNCNLGAYRAYFNSIDNIPAAPEEPQQGSNGAPRRRLVVGGNNVPAVTTGVDNLNVGDQPIKVMIDGQMYILRGDKMYDATGRVVK